MRARWDANGAVVLWLEGALRGRPEEGCVRDVTGALSVEAGGAAGEIVHLVRR